MNSQDIQHILDEHPSLREKLFCRGFYFTNAAVKSAEYPFYGLWKVCEVGAFRLLVSPRQNFRKLEGGGVVSLLIGHAYDPFSGNWDEGLILKELLANFREEELAQPQSHFWNVLNHLTGVFTLLLVCGEKVFCVGDASGMQTTFYSTAGNCLHISSHTNLIGDLLGLSWTPYITKLRNYRFFKLLGNSLPGDLTQFAGLKRLVPNHFVEFHEGRAAVHRFYWPAKLDLSPEDVVSKVARLLQDSLKLIAEKWKRPAISLTGGCDSKTTLACAKGLYDKFSYFSYVSSESEEVDAVAAAKICQVLGLKHTTYTISENDADFPELPAVREILNWNTGNLRHSNANDVRKRIFFADTADFDVEVKSWASEIGRAYYSKRFHGRTDFGPEPTPRKCTTLYKFFLHNRRLVRETDQVFAEYLDRYWERAQEKPVEWQEQFFWEFRVPSWNGLVITGEHRYSFDITIPYNNRRILELLLSVPIEMRVRDELYQAIRQRMNPEIDKTGIAVTNLKHTQNRERLENLYYILNTLFPW